MSLENTHFGAEKIGEMLNGAKKLFFAGIGGVSMCSLAKISKLRGYSVSGYDRASSAITASLEESGIDVYFENDISHIENCDMLIYTVAIPAETPEYSEALRRGIPCVSRADYLGYIMSGYKKRIGISGMHGKTTTTSITSKLFNDCGFNPTSSCGGIMKDVGSEYKIGGEEYFVFEACEYMDSFLDFYPTTAVVLNIEMDHVDYFHSMDQIITSYKSFLAKTGASGTAIVNCDDDEVMKAAEGYEGKLITFGINNKQADFTAENITYDHGCGEFDFVYKDQKLARFKLSVPGKHVVYDALAAAAACLLEGGDIEKMKESLLTFEGAGRRMDPMGLAKTNARIYSDYAHHPTEIKTTLNAASEMGYERVFCVFQPHTYSRTAELFDDFASSLSNEGIYEIILAPIYSARETNIYGVSSENLKDKIKGNNINCTYIEAFDDIAMHLTESTKENDMILIMGAGDITKVIPYLK